MSEVATAYADWLRARAEYVDPRTRSTAVAAMEDVAEIKEDEAMWRVIKARSRHVEDVRHKLEVLAEILADSEWRDARDRIMVASLAADLDALDIKTS